MKYTKGKAGPTSRMTLEITYFMSINDGPNSRARGEGIAILSGGRKRGVNFLVQGGNFTKNSDLIKPGAVLDVTVRWTGGSAVTIIETHRPMAKAA